MTQVNSDSVDSQATSVEELAHAAENSLKKVVLRENLEDFPEELLTQKQSLSFLDLSQNKLTSIPSWLPQLQNLSILFISYNQFSELQPHLGSLPQLRMLGARGNKIEYIHPSACAPSLRWLTLTDNVIQSIPEELGRCKSLTKLLLAGNRLTSLPSTLSSISTLELLRLSANQFAEIPSWILEHPTLAWIALAGNPCTSGVPRTSDERATQPSLPTNNNFFDWQSLKIYEELGRGASGVTYRGSLNLDGNELQVAVKVFSSTVSSDGYAVDEISSSLSVEFHDGLLLPIGAFQGHPQRKMGLVYPLLAKNDWRTLAGPPSFASITRDIYNQELKLPAQTVLQYAVDLVSATHHLHSNEVIHGDLYAHNTLVNGNHAKLSDFGACMSTHFFSEKEKEALYGLEKRALGILLNEIVQLIQVSSDSSLITSSMQTCADLLIQPQVALRPKTAQVLDRLQKLLSV